MTVVLDSWAVLRYLEDEGSAAAAVADLLAHAVGRRAPLVVHVVARAWTTHGAASGSGHEAWHVIADTGAVLLFARSVQEAVDLTLVARRVAEEALVPVVVAVDADLVRAQRGLTGLRAAGVELERVQVQRADHHGGIDGPVGDGAASVGADRRQGNKIARSRLQKNSRLTAIVEEMSFSRRDLTSRNNNLVVAATTGNRRKETENGPG